MMESGSDSDGETPRALQACNRKPATRPCSSNLTRFDEAARARRALANNRRDESGYPRAHAVAVPIVQPQHPLAPTHGRSFPAAPRAVVAGVSSRPEQPPRGVPIAQQAQPKVNPLPAVTPSPQEINNSKDSERSKEDSTTVVINDRKVNLMDSESGSLYALCRSWVRNGVPHESQPSFGTGAPILPRPLPASVVDSRISEKDNDAEKENSEEEKNETGEYTASDLLKQHVKRSKKIRAGLQKERLRRIERYKQRLALLLPPPSELGKHDGHSPSYTPRSPPLQTKP
uniref:Uncharacterized protein n=1 Tax=Oryza meridionalis TaxID=40149 RepID=A0A0E0CXL7_9ORYZ